jgi:hypothetical protein
VAREIGLRASRRRRLVCFWPAALEEDIQRLESKLLRLVNMKSIVH